MESSEFLCRVCQKTWATHIEVSNAAQSIPLCDICTIEQYDMRIEARRDARQQIPQRGIV